MNFLTAVSRQMTRFTALIIVLASIVAFIEPATFSWVKGDTQVIVLGIIMLGMGMTLGKEDYQILANARSIFSSAQLPNTPLCRCSPSVSPKPSTFRPD